MPLSSYQRSGVAESANLYSTFWKSAPACLRAEVVRLIRDQQRRTFDALDRCLEMVGRERSLTVTTRRPVSSPLSTVPQPASYYQKNPKWR